MFSPLAARGIATSPSFDCLYLPHVASNRKDLIYILGTTTLKLFMIIPNCPVTSQLDPQQSGFQYKCRDHLYFRRRDNTCRCNLLDSSSKTPACRCDFRCRCRHKVGGVLTWAARGTCKQNCRCTFAKHPLDSCRLLLLPGELPLTDKCTVMATNSAGLTTH